MIAGSVMNMHNGQELTMETGMENGIRTTLLALCCASALALPTTAAAAADGISLVCGGIGVDESAPLRADSGKHALTILFTTTDGAYLAGVQTRVDDPLNDLAAESECGPVGHVEVQKAGRYRVSTEFGGKKRTEWFDLKPGGGARTTMRWAE